MSELPLDTLIAALRVAQGVMGGIDTLLNHELIARLPHRAETRAGWLSWALSALALFAAAWSVRDFVAWRKLS